MKRPNELAPWKRAAAFLGFTAASIYLVFNVLHSITLDCTPANNVVSCVHREHRAWLTTEEVRFAAPPAERVTVRRWGKGDNLGDLAITTETGREVEVRWLSAKEAQAAASSLVAETSAGRPYHLASNGPRWWLLLLLFTVPVALSFVLPQRHVHAPPETLARLAPPLQDKKKKRAERKARQRAKTTLPR